MSGEIPSVLAHPGITSGSGTMIPTTLFCRKKHRVNLTDEIGDQILLLSKLLQRIKSNLMHIQHFMVISQLCKQLQF